MADVIYCDLQLNAATGERVCSVCKLVIPSIDSQTGLNPVDPNKPFYVVCPGSAGAIQRATEIERLSSTGVGAGTELKKLLKLLGITPTPHCKCDARAIIMNQRGTLWCWQHIDQILDWLKEEALERHLDFPPKRAKALIRLAIVKASIQIKTQSALLAIKTMANI